MLASLVEAKSLGWRTFDRLVMHVSVQKDRRAVETHACFSPKGSRDGNTCMHAKRARAAPGKPEGEKTNGARRMKYFFFHPGKLHLH